MPAAGMIAINFICIRKAFYNDALHAYRNTHFRPSSLYPSCAGGTEAGATTRPAPAPGFRRRVAAGRLGARIAPDHSGTVLRPAVRPTLGRGSSVVRARSAGAAVARLGNPALRQLFAAPRPDLRAHAHPACAHRSAEQ